MNHYYKILGEQPIGIVVEMGLGACLSEWIPTAKLLAKKEGVLLYERAGINKSEASSKERTPFNIAMELHDLLEQVKHQEKLIVIAHSQGGLYAQQFCRLFPEMIKGLILLDPLTARDNEFKTRLTAKEYKKSGVDKSGNFEMMRKFAKMKLGFLTKILLKQAPPFYYYKEYSSAERKEILESADSVIHASTVLEEYREAHEEKEISNLAVKGDFPDIPLILITHDRELAVNESMQFGHNTREFAEKIEDMWQELMKEYLDYSEMSRWIRAEKSTHYIHLTEPGLLVDALENF